METTKTIEQIYRTERIGIIEKNTIEQIYHIERLIR